MTEETTPLTGKDPLADNLADLFKNAQFPMPARFNMRLDLVPDSRMVLKDGGQEQNPEDGVPMQEEEEEEEEGRFKFRVTLIETNVQRQVTFESAAFDGSERDLTSAAHNNLRSVIAEALARTVLNPARLPQYEVVVTENGGARLKLIRGYDGETV